MALKKIWKILEKAVNLFYTQIFEERYFSFFFYGSVCRNRIEGEKNVWNCEKIFSVIADSFLRIYDLHCSFRRTTGHIFDSFGKYIKTHSSKIIFKRIRYNMIRHNANVSILKLNLKVTSNQIWNYKRIDIKKLFYILQSL